jgi:hypothetical protein
LVAEKFVNSKDRLDVPTSFWSDLSWEGWQVTPDGEDGARVFWPLISNDGQSLVLVGLSSASAVSRTTVLKIYRKNGHAGKLVGNLHLTDLWTGSELKSDAPATETDATPMWFAGGSLAFSPDNRILIYRSRWNDVVRIRLIDGTLSRTNM